MPLRTASDSINSAFYFFAGTGAATGSGTYVASQTANNGVTGFISQYAVEIGAICAIVSALAAIIFGVVGIYIRFKSLKIQKEDSKKSHDELIDRKAIEINLSEQQVIALKERRKK